MHLHEYGFSVEIDPVSGATFRNPDGGVIAEVPPRPRPPDLGWKAIEAQNQNLDIRLENLPPGWNGEHVYWPWVVEEIFRADRRSAAL
jgi:hypothetical protein